MAAAVRAPWTSTTPSWPSVEFENGAIGTLEASRFCRRPQEPQTFEING